MNYLKKKVINLLASADIRVNGNRPWDIKVKNEKFYARIFSNGSLGFGESYMDDWWECKRMDIMFYKILSANLDKKVNINPRVLMSYLAIKIFNLQSKSRAFQVGEEHYNLGNDLYRLMLDKRMVYTCGYWKNAKTLDKAQEDKLDLVCKKLNLKPGQTVLDIGCGWGSFMKFAAEKYKVNCVGISISKEQVEFGKEMCKGLPIKFKLQDYRDVTGKFDHIVSLGMFEHVGPKNYREYMKVVSRCLKENGLFLLHTIGNANPSNKPDPWIEKYIFPNGFVPTQEQLVKSINGIFIIEDWHNFSNYYDLTLMAWNKNFNKNWNLIKSNYSERFKRMWNYYLLACAGTFRARKSQLWQVVLSKNGVIKGYNSVR